MKSDVISVATSRPPQAEQRVVDNMIPELRRSHRTASDVGESAAAFAKAMFSPAAEALPVPPSSSLSSSSSSSSSAANSRTAGATAETAFPADAAGAVSPVAAGKSSNDSDGIASGGGALAAMLRNMAVAGATAAPAAVSAAAAASASASPSPASSSSSPNPPPAKLQLQTTHVLAEAVPADYMPEPPARQLQEAILDCGSDDENA